MLALSGVILVCSCTFALHRERRENNAGEERRERYDREEYKGRNAGEHNKERPKEDAKHYRHYYRDGKWWYRNEAGNWVLSGLVAGAVVDGLPPDTTSVTVQGQGYYYDGTNYYSQLPDGTYVVSEPPQQLLDGAEVVK